MIVKHSAWSTSRVDLSQELTFNFTQANHVYVEGPVVINGVDYNFSVHLYKKENGWKINDSIDIYFNKQPSLVARKKAKKVIPNILSETIDNIPDIHDIRKQAEIKSASSTIQDLEETIEDLQEKMCSLKQKLQKQMLRRFNAKDGILSDTFQE